MSIVVRKARKSYVCDGCGRIIQVGTEYLDDVVIKYGNVVHHKRYHDECPDEGTAMELFRKIIAANGDLIVSTPSGDKVHIYGITYLSGACCVHIRRWDHRMGSYIALTGIKDWVDEHGERILSKS